MSALWSYLLAAVGVAGLYLAGQYDRRGWYIGLAAQALWIAYATATRQWGFYVSAIAYGWVYARNARRADKRAQPSPPVPPAGPIKTSDDSVIVSDPRIMDGRS